MKPIHFETNDGNKVLHFSNGEPQRGVPTFSINQWWSWSMGHFASKGITATNSASTSTVYLLPERSENKFIGGLTTWGIIPTYKCGASGVYQGSNLQTYIDFARPRSGTTVANVPKQFITHNPWYSGTESLEVVAWYNIDYTNRENESFYGFYGAYNETGPTNNPYYEFQFSLDVATQYNLFPFFMPIGDNGRHYDYALDMSEMADFIMGLYVRDTVNASSSTSITSTTLYKGKLVVLGVHK